MRLTAPPAELRREAVTSLMLVEFQLLEQLEQTASPAELGHRALFRTE